MSDTDHDASGGDRRSTGFRGVRGRKAVVLGIAGLATVGAGTAVTIGYLRHDSGPAVSIESTGSSAGSSAAGVGPRASGAGARPAADVLAASAKPVTDAERIASARAAAKNTRPIRHPLPQLGPPTPPSALHVENTGSIRAGQTLRLVSARSDLTGQNELAWVADAGTKVGAARCSQTFRFANETKPSHKPNLLVCWRTSAAKSVYTVMVNLSGKPSRTASVAAITKEWEKLG